MKAIILAAGMGTRLGKHTENLPKGMLNFLGKSLIERQVETLRAVGINDIIIVTGYQKEKIQIPGVKYYHNPDFAGTNMVESLFCAEAELAGEVLVAYSDIIYTPDVLQKVINANVEIGVTVDDDYWVYWQARLAKPERDMESLVIDNEGKIIELGDTHCSRDQAKVRYVGLLRFSASGVEALKKVYHQHQELHFNSEQPWLRSKCFKKAYMTCMMQALINAGYRVDPIHIVHGWMEFDTVEDYEKAVLWSKNGSLDRLINLS